MKDLFSILQPHKLTWVILRSNCLGEAMALYSSNLYVFLLFLLPIFSPVVNVTSDSFKPPAGHHLQRGSPDLHGCWMLPQENKSSPKTRVVQNEDSDLDDDSDEEEEKAVIRIGSGFQAIIPDKRQPSTSML